MGSRLRGIALSFLLTGIGLPAEAQVSTRDSLRRDPRTILAIGAHAGDMELTAGALLIKHQKLGDRVVILHMTLGEGGNRRISPTAYGAQKRREALAASAVIGAEAIFAPYRDGEIPDDEETRRYMRVLFEEYIGRLKTIDEGKDRPT